MDFFHRVIGGSSQSCFVAFVDQNIGNKMTNVLLVIYNQYVIYIRHTTTLQSQP